MSKRASLSDNDPLNHLFTPSDTPEKSTPPKRRPPAAPDRGDLIQTTLMVYQDQLDWMDETCFNARKKGGKSVSKAALLRALIDLAKTRGVNLEGVKKDDEIIDRLKKAFGIK